MKEETRNKTLAHFGKSEKELAEDVGIIKEWLETQPHLPEMPSTTMIETFIVNNKFSLEKAKNKIDTYYNIRGKYPNIFSISNPKTPQMKACWDTVYSFNLPKLVDDMYQVTFCKVRDYIPNDFNVDWWTSLCIINTIEVMLLDNFVLGTIVIVDEEQSSMNHILSVTPSHLKHAMAIIDGMMSSRVKAFHLINCPPYLDVLLKICKAVLKPKLFDRIKLHKSIESLAEYVPLDMLPRDYGGKEKSIHDLQEDWKEKLNKHQDRFDKLDTFKVNESLRPTPMEDTESFGIQGTFKKLNIDWKKSLL